MRVLPDASTTYRAPINGFGTWHGCCSTDASRRYSIRRPGQETKVTYTHYDYLELAPGATSNRIEAAYAALLERFQYGMTDAGQDLSGLVRMIHAAYAVLSDPESRKAYDAQLSKEAAAADAELQLQLDSQPLPGFTRVQKVPETLMATFPELAA
jgi:DnaJ-class molecular chaperone